MPKRQPDPPVEPELTTWCERKRIHGSIIYTRTTETGNGGLSVKHITEAEWRISEFARLTDELNRLGPLREEGGSTEEDFIGLLDVAEDLRAMFDDIPGGHPFEKRSVEAHEYELEDRVWLRGFSMLGTVAGFGGRFYCVRWDDTISDPEDLRPWTPPPDEPKGQG